MVEFTNLRTDKDWIYADAHDIDFDAYAKVKISKSKSEVEINNINDKDNFIKKACWNLKDIYKENNNRLPRRDLIQIVWC